MANFILTGLGASLALTTGYVLSLETPSSFPRPSAASMFSPIAFFYFASGSVLIHAVLFAQAIEDRDGNPLRFGKASLLALVYVAISGAVSTFVTFVIAMTRGAA
jgi:hypothetical protein